MSPATGHGERLAFEVAEKALLQAAMRQGVLHDGEADQEHDEHESAAKRRLDDVVVDAAGHRHIGGRQPGEDHQPTGYEHHRPVVTLDRERADEAEPATAVTAKESRAMPDAIAGSKVATPAIIRSPNTQASAA